MKTLFALLTVCCLSACDPYADNGTGNTKINEIRVYGNVRCVLVTQAKSNTISCDWNHPIDQPSVPQ